MDELKRKALKAKIEIALQTTENNVANLLEATQPISPENSLGRITRMDAINNKGVAEAALRSAKKKLANLSKALKKIDDPDFGTCQSCQKMINPSRLMFMPESTTCIKCAR